jgi:hypothetical protein
MYCSTWNWQYGTVWNATVLRKKTIWWCDVTDSPVFAREDLSRESSFLDSRQDSSAWSQGKRARWIFSQFRKRCNDFQSTFVSHFLGALNRSMAHHLVYETTEGPSRIAFGSCNDQDHQNNLWPIIESRSPAAFVWGGDAIYAGMWKNGSDMKSLHITCLFSLKSNRLCRRRRLGLEWISSEAIIGMRDSWSTS